MTDIQKMESAFQILYSKLCAYESSWPTREVRAARRLFYESFNKLGN